MPTTIEPGATFKDSLARLPAIDGVRRVDLLDAAGAVVGSIENQPGKQGSLAVYAYLAQAFGTLDAAAANHGLALFAEHTPTPANGPAPTPISIACSPSPPAPRRCGSRSTAPADPRPMQPFVAPGVCPAC